MSYSFWHSGILIGESDLDQPGNHPRQIGGFFRPTAYGFDIFPRLTGILTAGHAFKEHLESKGLELEELDKNEVADLLDTTPAGRKIIDIGRMLSDVELRGPDGRQLEFTSIAFTDLKQLKELVTKLDLGVDTEEWPEDSPRYIVSATLVDDSRRSSTQPIGNRCLN